MTLSAGTRLGRYEIRSKLGAGGMGEVYLAQDTSELGRNVALKILPAEVAGNKDRLQRFTQEARTVSNLNHPNILTVHEFGQTESASFMATEYVDGVTLRQHLSGRRLKLVDVLDVTIQIVAALNAAHEAGVTHRDLKPENVMIRKDHIVKVLDFGLAKPSLASSNNSIDSEAGTRVMVHTEPGVVMGTVSYMSPEQSVGRGVDQRTDIWSVGVVLYEMLAGVLPFDGKDIHRQIIAIQEQEAAPLAQQVEGVPERLEEIVSKCLAKEKDERYQTAKDLLIDLRNLRRKLDVDAEIERTVSPAPRRTSAQDEHLSTAVNTSSPTTSSAEYVASGIKQHKLAVGIIVTLVITAVAVASSLYLRTQKSSVVFESIAILPFENKGNAADTEYLSDGLAESLIYRLSQLPNLKVSPRSSVFRYKGKEIDAEKVGAELGVDAVMSGRLIQRGDNLTISVDLVDVRNKKSLWGEQYERKVSDLLATQREIASAITEKLQLKLSGNDAKSVAKQYTNSNEAYQAYLKGRFFWNKRDGENLRKAIEQFKSASEIDANFALAYVGLADCYGVAAYYDSTLAGTETLLKAKAYAVRALEIDDSLSETHASLANVNTGLWNWDEAEKGYKRAIALNPNYSSAHQWYGNQLTIFSRFDEAIAEIKRAQALEPLSPIINLNLAELYMLKGDLPASLDQNQRTFDLDPNWYFVRQSRAMLYLKQGRSADAETEAEKSVEMSARETFPLGVLGFIYARNGRRAAAQAILDELKQLYELGKANGHDLARISVGLGERDQAFAWLEKDFQARSSTMPAWLANPPFDSLHDDARYKDLARRMGILR